MQIYGSHEWWGDYHPNFPITRLHRTNGMRTRMFDLHYALRLPVITNIKDAQSHLLIEPFACSLRPEDRDYLLKEGWAHEKAEAMQRKYVEEVIAYRRGQRHLICSEMQLLRWTGNIRDLLMPHIVSILCDCLYQQNLFAALNLKSRILYEPINEFLFYPTEKKPKSIIAVGSQTPQKNAEMLIEFYRALEGSGFHRIYIGSPMVWGNYEKYNPEHKWEMDLYHEMQSVCDEFYDASCRTFISQKLSECEFFVNFAYHEVTCRAMLEALMAGCGIIWGLHPLGNEYPMLCMADSVAEAVRAVEKHTGNIDAAKMREFAFNRHAFVSVRQQFQGLMYEN